MGVMNRAGDFGKELRRGLASLIFHLPSPLSWFPRERTSLHQPHAEVMASGVLADLVNRDDVWMVEQSDSFSLVTKAADLLEIGEFAGPDHLEGDDPFQRALPRAPHHPHASAAQ